MRYFFHRLDDGLDRDEEGTECASLREVRLEAVLYAAGTIRDRPEYLWEGGRLRIEVTDEAGSFIVAVVMFSTDRQSDAVKLETVN